MFCFQRQFLQSNLLTAVALSVARICNCPDARTQMRELVVSAAGRWGNIKMQPENYGDCVIWNKKYGEVVQWERLDKLRMQKINKKTP